MKIERSTIEQLFPDSVRNSIPAYGTDIETDPPDKIVPVKFFTPDAQWTWYVLDGQSLQDDIDGLDGVKDFEFFGLVDGLEIELGYFVLSDLLCFLGPFGLHIERDEHWTPKKMSEACPEYFMKYKMREESQNGCLVEVTSTDSANYDGDCAIMKIIFCAFGIVFNFWKRSTILLSSTFRLVLKFFKR